MNANVMATAWMIIWFVIAIALVTHFGLNAYRESKRKRIEAEEKLKEQQKEFEKEFNKFTQQENEIHEKLEVEDLEILDLLYGYKENTIIFNFNSFIRLLKQYKFRYAITSAHAHNITFEIRLNYRTCILYMTKFDNGVNVMIYDIDTIAKG